VNLEKDFDAVPREIVQLAMRKFGVEEWLICVVMNMYNGLRTSENEWCAE